MTHIVCLCGVEVEVVCKMEELKAVWEKQHLFLLLLFFRWKDRLEGFMLFCDN